VIHRSLRACLRLFLLAGLGRAAAAQIPLGTAQPLDVGWTFALADDPGFRRPDFDDRAWTQVALPHDWSIRQPMRPDLASCTGYLPAGIGWYRQTLLIPTQPGRDRVYLYFEGVYNRSEVYLNGQRIGGRPNGYVSFVCDATAAVRFDHENTIAVRVDHHRSADSRWYTGSGLYRPVFLLRAGPVHFAPWGVFVHTDRVDADGGHLAVEAETRNDSDEAVALTLRYEVRSPAGTLVATSTGPATVPAHASTVSRGVLVVPQPQLWDLTSPSLYRVRTTVLHEGRELDATTVRTGIRSLAFDANTGFRLNGASLKMKGVCLHHDAGVLGAAVPRAVWRQRLLALKGVGANAVRTSHNPQSADLYDLCDELGLLVLDEAFDEWELPKRKWLRGWNVGEPGFEGSCDFFAEWSERDLADQVRRDRNHPSVFAWSIGNEVDYPNDPYSHPVLDGSRINQPMFGGYKPDRPPAARLGVIAHRLAAVVRREDPTRPVTAALAGVVMSNETEYPAALDLTGYNYTEERYATDHARYPQRVIYGSENGHSFAAWRAVRDHDYIFGQFLWTGIDYLGEAGPWPSRGSTAGLLDLTGAVKPRGHFRAALWSDRPVAYLGTEIAAHERPPSIDAWPVWNYEPGTRVRVLGYTNAARARLRLNGRPVAETRTPDPATGIIAWGFRSSPASWSWTGSMNGAPSPATSHCAPRAPRRPCSCASNRPGPNRGARSSSSPRRLSTPSACR
jgi:beta-galactosidase/beta-glucuronidase